MKKIIAFVKELFSSFFSDDTFRMGAALAYYTVFSFAPIIVIVIASAGFFFGEEAVRGEIYNQLKGLLGPQTAIQAQELVENSYKSDQGRMATTISIVTLFLGATGVFTELKNALNTVWGVKAKPRSGVINFLVDRLLSFGMVLTIGFMLLVSLVWDSMLTAMADRISRFLPDATATLVYILNFALSFALTSFLFAVIFKVLPDARIRWRDVIVGSMFTSVMFIVGKFLIGFYIGNSNVSSTFGAAGSIAVLMIWTFYAAQILFLGAEFTYVYAKQYGAEIVPNGHAVRVVRQEIEKPDHATEAPKQQTIEQNKHE